MPDKKPPSSRLYKQRAAEVAFSYAPTIYPCYHCGSPVAKGYCCRWCSSLDPEGHEARRTKK